MSGAVLGRWMWKEYRTLRAFWISMAVLATLMQLLPLALFDFAPSPLVCEAVFGIAFSFAALYAVACGATMFAGEHEEGTYESLRGLPVSAREFLSGKLAFAVVSTLLLGTLLWLVAMALCRGQLPNWHVPGWHAHLQLWGLFGVAAIEGLAWAMLFSLLLKRPLAAAMLGIFAASVGIHISIVVTAAPSGGYTIRDLGPYVAAIPYRMAIALAVLLVDFRLASRWLQPASPAAGGWTKRWARAPQASSWMQQDISFRPSRAAILVRLVWQSWRQSAPMIATLAGLGAAVILLFPFHSVFDSELPRIPVIVVVASLMGSCVFLADQEGRRVRFLAEQGIPPRYVWLARQLVWLTSLAIWAAVVYTLLLVLADGSFWHRPQPSDWRERMLGRRSFYWNLSPFALSLWQLVLAFSAGQLASMLLRSGILAGFVGLVLTGALCAWMSLMQLLEVSWLWSVAPIPCVLFFATWLRTPDWILERNGPRAWLRVGAALAAPAAALLVAVPAFRVYQIPDVSPGFSPEKFARPITPQERETADLYRRAGELLVQSEAIAPSRDWKYGAPTRTPDAAELAFLKANGESLALLLKASRRPDCSFFDLRRGRDEISFDPTPLIRLLDVGARERESAGQFDEARDRYLAALRFIRHFRQNAPSLWCGFASDWEIRIQSELPLWAAQPGQTSARIVAAIKQLEELDASQPRPADAIKAGYLRVRRSIAGGLEALAESGLDPQGAALVARWTLLPWERNRALRLLNVVTAHDVQLLDTVSNLIATGEPIVGFLPDLDIVLASPDRQAAEVIWWRTTFLLMPFYKPYTGAGVGWELARVETRRRATRLLLAIEAWKLDRGELPHSLAELVGPYLDEMPLDPYHGRPFRYFREGLAMPPELLANSESSNWPRPPQKPFIWSGGEKAEYQIPRDTDIADATVAGLPVPRDDFSIPNDSERWNSPSSKYVLFLSGQWFEIP